ETGLVRLLAVLDVDESVVVTGHETVDVLRLHRRGQLGEPGHEGLVLRRAHDAPWTLMLTHVAVRRGPVHRSARQVPLHRRLRTPGRPSACSGRTCTSRG